ncbi:MAG: acyltransferase, partial [Arenicellales bacterium]
MTRSARKTHHVVTQGGSALSRYQDVIVGQRSLVFLLYFEFCLLLGPLPGALGLTLRRLFWPRLFAACGRGTLFGRDITLRHPGRLKLGSNVVIGDNVTLDGRSSSDQPSVSIGNNAMIADDCTLTS